MPRVSGSSRGRYWQFCVAGGRLYRLPIYGPSSKVMRTPSRPVSAANRPEALACARKIKCLFMDEGWQQPSRLVGIAAPQLGHSLRLIGMRVGGEGDRPPPPPLLLLQNPAIVAHSLTRRTSIEGCLSVPGERRRVLRYDAVLVEFQSPQDPTQTYQRRLFRGLASFVIQHELNHLEARPWWRSGLASRVGWT